MAIPSTPPRMLDGRAQYWREISAVLVLKTLGLLLIYLLCFGPWNTLEPSAATMFHHLLSPAVPAASESIHD